MGDGIWTKKQKTLTEAEVISDVVASPGSRLAQDGLVEVNHLHGGLQAIYHFANGYGASVVRHQYSYGYEYGLWELAVLKSSHDGWNLDYDTPIAEDVLGHLEPSDVDELLILIKNL